MVKNWQHWLSNSGGSYNHHMHRIGGQERPPSGDARVRTRRLNAMKFMLTSLDRHSDYGFGEVARSFEQAADHISEVAKGQLWMQAHFPINYLYRHAAELYLKSCIINVHRYLNGGTINVTDIKIGDKQRSITNTHSLKCLFDHFKNLVTDNKSRIENGQRTKWSEIPDDLPGLIDEIEIYDSRSTYFRYPGLEGTPIEAEKSSMKKIDPSELISKANCGERLLTFVEVNDNDEIKNAYLLDKSALSTCQELLRKATGHLSGASIGLRMELANGE